LKEGFWKNIFLLYFQVSDKQNKKYEMNPFLAIHPRNIKHLSHYLESLVESYLWAKVLLGMILGVSTGILLGPSVGLVNEDTAHTLGSWLVLPGNIFLTIIQMIVIPLVVASVIRGIASSSGIDQLKKVGIRLLLYFLCTTTIAVTIGIGLAMLVKPGSYVDINAIISQESVTKAESFVEGENAKNQEQSLPENVVSIIPENPFNAAVEMDMLGIVIFSVIFGLALISIEPRQSKPLLDLLGSLQSVVMRVVRGVMKLAPFAVFGFMAQLTLQTGLDSLLGLGVYIGVVLSGLFLMLLVYTLIVFLVGGVSPWRFFSGIREAQLLAFSTNSSVAVMPVSIRVAEEKFYVRPSITQFVIPIGATVNMDGTALFHGIATLFLTQAYGMDITFGALLALVVTVIGASIGTPATPGVGMVMLSAVLTSAGIPLAGIALIIGVDRVLELFRTVTNVSGDIVASIVMNKITPNKQSYQEEMEEQRTIEAVQEKTGEDVLTGEIKTENQHGLLYKLFHSFEKKDL
jgi:Na+/H+-dicarboxylate symporter